jgi:hypothetical protein
MSAAKTCSCGAVFTRRAWDRLPSKGAIPDGRKYNLEFKDCPACGSTLAMPVRTATTTQEAQP